jgi:hypothetical protein
VLVAAKCITGHTLFSCYRAHRPVVSVRVNPRAWWAHAIGATLREVALLRHHRFAEWTTNGCACSFLELLF